jgi:hypothetical protein
MMGYVLASKEEVRRDRWLVRWWRRVKERARDLMRRMPWQTT